MVVAGAFQTAVVLMRNLVRRGLTACCIDWLPTQPGFRTVYGKAYLCPHPQENPAAWERFMAELAGRFPCKPVLICSSDQFVTAVSAHAERLKDLFVFCQAPATQALLATKERQYDIAGTHGLPVPLTQNVHTAEELMAFAAGIRFPCLLKPNHCTDWERVPSSHPLYGRKVVIVPSHADLAVAYRLAAEASPDVVVQEIIEGPDTAKLVYLSCYDRHSRRIGSCMLREVRTHPIHFGSASVVEPVSDPEADRLCDGFLQSIGYQGICEIELKRDTRDGCVKMIEANPRYSVTADAGPYAGVDIGWLHYLDLIGQPVAETNPSPQDFRHIVLLRDVPTIRSYRRQKLLTWRELIRSYRRPVYFFDFDWRDWRVSASTVLSLARFAVGRLLRRLHLKRESTSEVMAL